MRTKQDLIKSIQKQGKRLREAVNVPTEKSLSKCSKNELYTCLNAWVKTSVVEITEAENPDVTCKYCTQQFNKASELNSKVVIGLEGASKNHIIGIDCYKEEI